jgi:hypothetical protein
MEDITYHIALNIDNVQSLINYCTLSKNRCDKHLWIQLFNKWQLPIMDYDVTNWSKEFIKVYTIKNITVNKLLDIKTIINYYGYTNPIADYTHLLTNFDFYYLYDLAVTCTDDTFDRLGLKELIENNDTDLTITRVKIEKIFNNQYTIILTVLRDDTKNNVYLIFTEVQIRCVLFNMLYDNALQIPTI